MRIAFITAGAAGMYCGSCMKDNTLAGALHRLGHDAQLIPTYTPIRTDEEDVSGRQVFFGGVNVYLQQKSWLFRRTPWFFDRLLNARRLLNWAGKMAVHTKMESLGGLAISMLQGRDGRQRKELRKLIAYLRTEVQPDLILLTNVLLSGLAPALRAELGKPIWATLQGDDIFLEALPPPERARCVDLIAANGAYIDGYFATSRFYADAMAADLRLPRDRMHVVYPGLNLKGYDAPTEARTGPPIIGYFARIGPEKGFHRLIDGYLAYRKLEGAPYARLHFGGWLGGHQRGFFDEQMQRLTAAGYADDIRHVDCPSHANKQRFLRGLDVLSVPTVYHEPKGLYLLEAWASGVPVVQPRHGSFPELIEATGGGLLVEPADAVALAEGWRTLLLDEEGRRAMGERGRVAVRERFSAEAMARATLAVWGV